jgi:ADP-heptose:LPS heptosyltransferase
MPGKRYLIVRTDRLGDVLLTTPVASAIRAHDPAATIVWLVRRYAAPLLQGNPAADEVWTDDEGPAASLISRLRAGRFDVAVIAYPRWRTVWATWRAGIPLRIGPASKLYSALFTHRLWQHRSAGEKHEAEYNLELLEPLGIRGRFPTSFTLTPEERSQARKTLQGHRISFAKPLVVLHPGSGGSSERWPLSSFMTLGDRLQEAGLEVVVTGGPGELHQAVMVDQMKRIPVFIAAGSVSVRELAAIFSWADLVVSNSTGPLHLAVALDVPTVSIYSGIPTCHPRRWGPYSGQPGGSARHQVLVAPVEPLPRGDLGAIRVEAVWEACWKRLESPRVQAEPPGSTKT